MSDKDGIFHRVTAMFDGDESKTQTWFVTPNPLLGGVSPLEMMGKNRIERLEKFIAEAEAERLIYEDVTRRSAARTVGLPARK